MSDPSPAGESAGDRLFALSRDLLCVAGPDGRFQRVNPAFERVLGWTPDELVARRVLDLVHDDDRAATAEALRRGAAGDAHDAFETRYRHRDGSYRWLSWHTTPADERGLTYGVARDVTESRRAEAERRRAVERFRVVQDASPDNFSLWDPVRARDGTVVDFTLVYANAALQRSFGLPHTELRGRGMHELFPGAAPNGRFARYVEVLETGVTTDGVILYERDGRSFRLTVIRVGEGIAVTTSDVTARVQAEQVLQRAHEELERLVAERTHELREREERFRSLTEHASDAITILDVDGTLRYGSQAYERVFGYRLADIVGTSVFDLLHPDDRGDAVAVFQRLLASPADVQSAEFRIRRGDGAEAWVQAVGQSRLHDPAVRGIVVNTRDVTEQRLAANASRRSGAMFHGLAQQSITGSYIGQDDRVIYGNPRFAEIFGYSVHELTALPRLLDLIAPEAREQVSAMLAKRIGGGGDVQYSTLGLRSDGTRVPIEIYGSTIELDGRPAVVATVLDVTERVRAEAALRESEARYRVALDGMLDAFFVLAPTRDAAGEVVDFALVEANDAGEAMLGTALDDMRGLGLLELLPIAADSGLFEHLRRAAVCGERYDGEYRTRDPRARAEWLRLQVIPMPDGVAVTARDISAVKRAEAVLRDLAVRDDLTGLLNRRGFREMAEQEVRIARRHARRDAVLCLDLTGFKQINDTYGHTEGDRALAAVAVILRSTVRDGDLVARFGGDEFVIYAAGLRVEESGSMVARLRGALAEDNARAAARGRPYAIQTGIGAVELRPGEDLDAALARADAELYADKGTRGARLLPMHSSA